MSVTKLQDKTRTRSGGDTTTSRKAHAPERRGKCGHAAPLPLPTDLGGFKRLRVGHLMNLLAISHATLYARMHTGTLPRPDGYDGKRPFWKTSTVRAFLEG